MVMKIDDMPTAYWAVEQLADKLASSPAFRDMGILEQAPTAAARALAVGVLVGRVLGRIDDLMQDRNYRIAPTSEQDTPLMRAAFRQGYLQALDDLPDLLPDDGPQLPAVGAHDGNE